MSTIHQFLAGATAGDAITDHALLLQRWLNEMGITSHIYAEHIHQSVSQQVRVYQTYRPSKKEPFVIYHHSLGSAVADFMCEQNKPLLVIHHNVTPPHFFEAVNPAWAELARWGLRQLPQLRPHTRFAVGVSAFNEHELHEAGYTQTAVVPITFDPTQYNHPQNEALVQDWQNKRPLLLFVGRISPNKKQEDLLKLMVHLRRIHPQAHLLLIGDRWVIGYDQWLETQTKKLGIADAVTLTGKVSQADLVTAYKQADLYVSMSEHEGFGKPFIESMYHELPILAYSATATPYTLGGTGILFHEKRYAELAELIDHLLQDKALRRRIIYKQKTRVQDFLEPTVREQFCTLIQSLL